MIQAWYIYHKTSRSVPYVKILSTCAAYAKEKNLYNLDGWKRFRHLIQKEKQLTRAIKQSKIRQVRHAKKYMFGFLIPRNYTEALEFDKANNNSKWCDATKAELDSIHSYQVFQKHEKAHMISKRKSLMHPQDIRKSEFILFLQSSMMVNIKPELLLMDISLQNLLKAFTQELFH